MNRQETVITIAKINRLLKQLYYWIDTDVDLKISFVDTEELAQLSNWVKLVYQYLLESPTPILANQIERIGSSSIIENYLNEKNCRIDARIRPLLVKYVKEMKKLEILDKQILSDVETSYPGMVPALANEKAIALLKRAVDAGILDEDFQPLRSTSSIQLRVIAFAVGTLLNIPRKQIYIHFEKQWNRASYRISTVDLPRRYRCEKHELAMSLYPEVNFQEMTQPYRENTTFYTPNSKKRIKTLYENLIEAGYIGSYNTFEDFIGIFDQSKFKKPIDWISEQRFLAYFVYLAFSKYNKNLWVKVVCCFRVSGVEPHKGSLCSGLTYIRRNNLFDTYNVELKEIADKFNK